MEGLIVLVIMTALILLWFMNEDRKPDKSDHFDD